VVFLDEIEGLWEEGTPIDLCFALVLLLRVELELKEDQLV